MASLSHLPLSILTCLMFSIFISSASADSSDERVKLDLYYETLCIPSADFMVNNLSQIFKNDLINITDLHLIPYGNAKLSKNNTIICQHGLAECELNIIEACAMDLWPNVSVHYPILQCLESLVMDDNYFNWRFCFKKTGLDDNLIDDCYVTGKGNELELKYGKETDKLTPPHEYVPWVVVNGEPLKKRYEDFMSFICKAFKGNLLPKACYHLKPPQAKENDSKEVCNLVEKTSPEAATAAPPPHHLIDA